MIRYACRPLRAMYGRELVNSFGPLALKAIRQSMIDAGLTRSGINKAVNRIRRVFRWGVENELVQPATLQKLEAVRGLSAGRSKAKESDPQGPADESDIDALENNVLPQVWAMIQLQRFTGMRPGEVVTMRTVDIDRSGDVWIYRPRQHKNKHRGIGREVFIGPRAQAILKRWLKGDQVACLFSPREAMQWQRERRALNRKTKLNCGNRPDKNRIRKPKKQPGEVYSVKAYRNAVKVACKRLGIKTWSPNQLRHNAATWIRKEFDAEIAQVMLGHRYLKTTQIYAKAQRDKAMSVIASVG